MISSSINTIGLQTDIVTVLHFVLIDASISIYQLANERAHAHTRTHAHTHTRTHARTHAHTHAHTRTHTHAHARTHARARAISGAHPARLPRGFVGESGRESRW